MKLYGFGPVAVRHAASCSSPAPRAMIWRSRCRKAGLKTDSYLAMSPMAKIPLLKRRRLLPARKPGHRRISRSPVLDGPKIISAYPEAGGARAAAGPVSPMSMSCQSSVVLSARAKSVGGRAGAG